MPKSTPWTVHSTMSAGLRSHCGEASSGEGGDRRVAKETFHDRRTESLMSARDADALDSERPEGREVHVLIHEHDVVVGQTGCGPEQEHGKARQHEGPHGGDS